MSRYHHWLHGVLLIASGQCCGQAAELFGEDRRTVRRWVKALERPGFDGLRDGQRPRRLRQLTARQWQALERDLRKDPDAFGLMGGLRDGKLLSEHLRRRYGVNLGIH